jgi:hypothetical protein
LQALQGDGINFFDIDRMKAVMGVSTTRVATFVVWTRDNMPKKHVMHYSTTPHDACAFNDRQASQSRVSEGYNSYVACMKARQAFLPPLKRTNSP